jgi:hypothetical protein
MYLLHEKSYFHRERLISGHNLATKNIDLPGTGVLYEWNAQETAGRNQGGKAEETPR